MSEASVLASIGSERTMCLYDIRTGKAERKITMQVGHTVRVDPFIFLLLGEIHLAEGANFPS